MPTSTLHASSPLPIAARIVAVAGLSAALVLAGAGHAHAAGVPGDPDYLGSASTYAVLGAATVTNTGPSVITGDLGVYPGLAAVGFGGPGLGTVSGATHAGDTEALAARDELIAAYIVAEGLPSDPADLGTADLTGSSFTAGVYSSASSILINGVITLVGDADDVFVFQAGSDLTMGTGSTIALSGEVQSCNVYWQVGSSATLLANTTFVGTIMASQSISVEDAATIDGRLLAGAGARPGSDTGAVTLINDTVTVSQCDTDGDGDGDGTPGATPAPGDDSTSGAAPGDGSASDILPVTGQDNSPVMIGSIAILTLGGILFAASRRTRRA